MPVARPRIGAPRAGEVLTGAINGVNTVFQTPTPRSRESVSVFYNGVLMQEGGSSDYTLSESGGPGTGFDTITMTFAPRAGDVVALGPVVPLALAGGGLPPVTGVNGRAVIEVGGVPLFRGIRSEWLVPAFAVTGFNVSVSTREVGDTVTNPAFTASYNRAPSSVTVQDNAGGAVQDKSGTPTAFTYTGVYTRTVNNQSVVWNLSALDGSDPAGSSASVAWRPRAYFGVAADGLATEGDIEGLVSSFLAASRSTTLNVNAGAGQHIYYAYPDAYGAATFTVNGFAGGFTQVGTVGVTNAFGVTQNYRLYKSINPSLGVTTVVVS